MQGSEICWEWREVAAGKGLSPSGWVVPVASWILICYVPGRNYSTCMKYHDPSCDLSALNDKYVAESNLESKLVACIFFFKPYLYL